MGNWVYGFLKKQLVSREPDVFAIQSVKGVYGYKEYNDPYVDGFMPIYENVVDPATIGQCTGLRDKNGTLIFEGDILTLCETNPVKIIVSIESTKIGFSVVHRELTRNKLYSFCDKCEIIGNIQDTPELLGENP